MSTVKKTHNAFDKGLDLQLIQIIAALNGTSGFNIAVPDLTTGTRYALTVTLMRDDGGNIILGENGKPVPQLQIEELP